jgi:hypothetical protein
MKFKKMEDLEYDENSVEFAIEVLMDQRVIILDEIRFAEGLELSQLKANLYDIDNALAKLKEE